MASASRFSPSGRAPEPVHHRKPQPGLRKRLGVDALEPQRVERVERLEKAGRRFAQIAARRERADRRIARELAAQRQRSGAPRC